MSFLDSSGDIILDAILTDVGRMKLAKGDGSFSIQKFALCDDEIDYSLYDLTQPTGSQDIEILRTPIMESISNNSASMISKLLTIPRNDLLYLPVIKLNTVVTPFCSSYGVSGAYVVCVDSLTIAEFAVNNLGVAVAGVLEGKTGYTGNAIRVDQGLDTDEISPEVTLDPTLIETSYSVTIDSRFGSITPPSGNQTVVSPSFVDDDLLATYKFQLYTPNNKFVSKNTDTSNSPTEIIRGPRGTKLSFRIQASVDLVSNDYLFLTVGQSAQWTGKSGLKDVYFLDTVVRIVGDTTGYSVDVPIRFVRLK